MDMVAYLSIQVSGSVVVFEIAAKFWPGLTRLHVYIKKKARSISSTLDMLSTRCRPAIGRHSWRCASSVLQKGNRRFMCNDMICYSELRSYIRLFMIHLAMQCSTKYCTASLWCFCTSLRPPVLTLPCKFGPPLKPLMVQSMPTRNATIKLSVQSFLLVMISVQIQLHPFTHDQPSEQRAQHSPPSASVFSLRCKPPN